MSHETRVRVQAGEAAWCHSAACSCYVICQHAQATKKWVAPAPAQSLGSGQGSWVVLTSCLVPTHNIHGHLHQAGAGSPNTHNTSHSQHEVDPLNTWAAAASSLQILRDQREIDRVVAWSVHPLFQHQRNTSFDNWTNHAFMLITQARVWRDTVLW